MTLLIAILSFIGGGMFGYTVAAVMFLADD